MNEFNKNFEKIGKDGIPELPFDNDIKDIDDIIFGDQKKKDLEDGEEILKDLNSKYPLAKLYVEYAGGGDYLLGVEKKVLSLKELTKVFISEHNLSQKSPDDYIRGNF